MEAKPVNIIYCESPEEWIRDQYFLLANEKSAQRFLLNAYQKSGTPQPEKMAFRNAAAFSAYIRQALSIFRPGREENIWMQPVLDYYGMMSLIKAWILTRVPDYPQNTSVLRHGLSTRKRKRESYRLLEDEVRIQKEGLYPLVAGLLGNPPDAGDSYRLKTLFSFLSDLSASYERIMGETPLIPVTVGRQTSLYADEAMPLEIAETVLDRIHLTPEAFVSRLNHYSKGALFSLGTPVIRSGLLQLRWSHPDVRHVNDWEKGFHHPWFYEDKKGNHYLWFGNDCLGTPVDELLVHFMLLFALSMLCRYEPPLWGEIMLDHTGEEQILVCGLLRLIPRKVPHLVLNLLHGQKSIIRLY
ncbi:MULTISPECIES: YaaC family protein [Thermoactinomyces]|uniref:YaaC-like Protein n=1 Tax=Thermoactinomyces daqus TaxID=1329516 RepID=A0A7W1X8C1_9BACL|nr:MULTISPECIES: YaaC family protein [Thermoactinomyces]MBA4541945.1 hypothetical protein [Thermoactinomyces daqus]MBH8607752.1 hypothetical protein [Thermoactinomyces sp. CICC 10521]